MRAERDASSQPSDLESDALPLRHAPYEKTCEVEIQSAENKDRNGHQIFF